MNYDYFNAQIIFGMGKITVTNKRSDKELVGKTVDQLMRMMFILLKDYGSESPTRNEPFGILYLFWCGISLRWLLNISKK